MVSPQCDGMIEYSSHARERMAERNITEPEIMLCLSDPDRIEPDPLPDRIRFIRCILGQRHPYRVVVRANRRNFVITVHLDRRFVCP